MSGLKSAVKPFDISKREVWEAYEKVKANKGAPGVDGVGLAEFEADLRGNLYKIWNRMSSGSYFPPPVKAVEIPKPQSGGTRVLGVPTVADRIAQTVVAAQAGSRGRTDLSSRLLRLPPAAIGTGRGRDMPAALLEIRLGHRSGCAEVLRQRGLGTRRQGGAGTHRPALGAAVCEAVACRSAAATRRNLATTRPRYPTGVGDLAGVGQPVSALRVRHVDDPGVPGDPVRAVCRRRGRALCQ